MGLGPDRLMRAPDNDPCRRILARMRALYNEIVTQAGPLPIAYPIKSALDDFEDYLNGKIDAEGQE